MERGGQDKLRNLIFEKKSTNAFPAVFSVIFIAIHELIVGEKLKIVDYQRLKRQIENLTNRIETSRKATLSEERRKNVNTIKGLVRDCFVHEDQSKEIYANHAAVDIEAAMRRSSTELPHFEFKQGIVSLGAKREIDYKLLDRIVETICGMANNGPNRAGKLIIGVADKPADAERVSRLDEVMPRKVADKFVVGVQREAKLLDISIEKYLGIIRNHIERSQLSQHVKADVLSSIDFNAYFGLGVIVLVVPPQKEPSFVGEQMFWRDGDNTMLVDNAKLIANIGRRF